MSAGEKWLDIKAVAAHCAAHRETVLRWIDEGVFPPDRTARIRLRAVRVGGRWKVRPAWLAAFLSALSGNPEMAS